MIFSSKAPEINPPERPSLSRSQPGTHNPTLQEEGNRVDEWIHTYIEAHHKYFQMVQFKKWDKIVGLVNNFTASQSRNLIKEMY